MFQFLPNKRESESHLLHIVYYILKCCLLTFGCSSNGWCTNYLSQVLHRKRQNYRMHMPEYFDRFVSEIMICVLCMYVNHSFEFFKSYLSFVTLLVNDGYYEFYLKNGTTQPKLLFTPSVWRLKKLPLIRILTLFFPPLWEW